MQGLSESVKEKSVWIISRLRTLPFRSRAAWKSFPQVFILGVAMVASFAGVPALATSRALPQSEITIKGSVRNSVGEAVAGATVTLAQREQSFHMETSTKADGSFFFSGIGAGIYSVRAENAEWGKALVEYVSVSAGETKLIDLVLETKEARDGTSSNVSSGKRAAAPMDFEDKPNFTIAGVTDWSNVGLHGSGTDVRTSEVLAKDTLGLKSEAAAKVMPDSPVSESEAALRAAVVREPKSFDANHRLGEFYCQAKKYTEAIPLLETAQQIDAGNLSNLFQLALSYIGTGDLKQAREESRKMLGRGDVAQVHRLVGELDEHMGDPLGAVREFEQATRIEGSEENYFEWGSELLLHRAAQPAAEVFTKGSSAHPNSARMLTGLGAALYGAGSYEDAAKQLCKAADLQPEDPVPYVFLGKIEKAATESFPCSEEKLGRFAKDQPGNAVAHYYYGLILSKRAKASQNRTELHRAEAVLEKAVSLDPRSDEAYLQLGIVCAEQGDFAHAVGAYKKSIEVNPQLGEAHYRLGLAYKRIGEEAKAQREFQTYKQIEKADVEALERQRREQLQFLVIPKDSLPR